MKFKTVSILLIIIAFAEIVHSQDIFYPDIEPYLNASQKQELEKSVNILLKARGNENNARDIEGKYAKLKKRKNQEAWIAKTWEAKEQRILAEKNYKVAYKTIADVYSGIITKADYEGDSYKKEALSLNEQAFKNFDKANSVVSEYNETTKETLEKTDNEQIDSTLHNSHQLKLKGISLQIAALQIFIDKGKQALENKKEGLAWEKAKKTNTIDVYYEYLNNNPGGKHLPDANEAISLLEKQSAANEVADNNSNKNSRNNKNNTNELNNSKNPNRNSNNKNNSLGNLTFKVQIAASKNEISTWMLNAKAPGVKNIENQQSEGWIKYFIGTFITYQEAAKYRDEIRSHTPDAFIVVFSNGNQIQVTEEMKN